MNTQVLSRAAHEQLTIYVKVQCGQNSASAAAAAILGAFDSTCQGAV